MVLKIGYFKTGITAVRDVCTMKWCGIISLDFGLVVSWKTKQKKNEEEKLYWTIVWCFPWTKFWKFILEIVPVLELWVKLGFSIQYFRRLSTMTPFSIRFAFSAIFGDCRRLFVMLLPSLDWLLCLLFIFDSVDWKRNTERCGDDLSIKHGKKHREHERQKYNIINMLKRDVHKMLLYTLAAIFELHGRRIRRYHS